MTLMRAQREPRAGEPAGAPSPPEIDTLYAAHFHGLTAQLYAYTGDFGVAQEIVQEAFCRAIPRWSTIVTYHDPVAWLRRVAFNLAKSRWRKMRSAAAYRRRHREEYAPEPSPDRVALVAALAKLPPQQRLAIVLFYLADMPIAEIARGNGCSEANVKVWLYRGRAALASHLSDLREGRGRD